jgi:uncharacterized protein (DUF1778 family)
MRTRLTADRQRTFPLAGLFTSAERKLVQRAAAVARQSVSAFIVAATLPRAAKVLAIDSGLRAGEAAATQGASA